MYKALTTTILGISLLVLSGCSESFLYTDTDHVPHTSTVPTVLPPISSPDEEDVMYGLPGDRVFTQFAKTRPATGNKVLIVDPNIPAWAAYDAEGNLVKTGRASAGMDYCPDLRRSCRTVTGTFKIYSKKGANCKSSIFPLATHGGAPMPYCMHFYKGYALHGSYQVEDYDASHGCVRMIPSSAKWLSENFVEIGTTVIILPYKPKHLRYIKSSSS